MSISTLPNYSVLRDEQGRWFLAVCDTVDDLPISEVPDGALAYDISSRLLAVYDAASRSWGSADLTLGQQALAAESLSFAASAWSSGVLMTSGSSGSPLSAPDGTSALTSLHSIKEDAGFHYHSFNTEKLGVADGAGIVGLHHTLYLNDGASTDTAQTAQFHLNLVSGSTLKAGDFPAIGAALWTKLYGDAPSVAASAILASHWVENGLTGGARGAGSREYGSLYGSGNTPPTAALGFYGGSTGWDYLLDFVDTGINPIAAAALGGDASLKIRLGDTDYYIPLAAALD